MKKSLVYLLLVFLMGLICQSCGSDSSYEPSIEGIITINENSMQYFQNSSNYLPKEAALITIEFYSNTRWEASRSNGNNWLRINPTSGEAGHASLSITIDENTTFEERAMSINIHNTGVNLGHGINTSFFQAPTPTVQLDTGHINVLKSGGYIDVVVRTNADYSVVIDDNFSSWIKQVGTRSLTTKTWSFYVSENENELAREGVIHFKNKDNDEVLTIVQSGETTEDDFIKFVDPAVKAACIEHWDSNGDHELSFKEAAEVKSLEEVFMINEEITSFDEFKHFTGLKSIAEGTFNYDINLTHITLPATIQTIGEQAFMGCDKLKVVTLPNGLEEIKTDVFTMCPNLHQINLPESVKTIGEYTFADSGLTDIRLPKALKRIETGLFYGCIYLKSITLPEQSEVIGVHAFSDCRAIESITLPTKLTTLENGIFSNCNNLKSVTCLASTPPIFAPAYNNEYEYLGYNVSPEVIFVPKNSVNAYKTAKGWKEYANVIKAMP